MVRSRSKAPRSPRGTAAGGGDPGTNTSAADQAVPADVSESAGASAPADPPVCDGPLPLSEPLELPPEGGGSDGAPAGMDIPDRRVLSVRAIRAEGMRRAGRYWSGAKSTEVPVSEFTEAQLEQLLAEPLLKVSMISTPQEDAS